MKAVRALTFTQLALWFIVALVLFSLGWYTSRYETLHEVSANIARPVRYTDPEYPLISPLVSIAIPDATGFPELKSIKDSVADIISSAKNAGTVDDVGVYFRLPGNAHWFGINENEKFSPGSLIKVPIMMAVLKETETNPAILKKELRYDAGLESDIPNALRAQLPSGNYTVEKLLRTMIVDSDNVAKELLYTAAGAAAIQDVFDETNANFLTDPAGTISPKAYTVFLSRIYNATYLNRFYSNYAMNLLSQTTFKNGLVAGLPSDVPVAHKYGESGIYQDKALTQVELHDCGLIYVPDEPYYLCVMTKGQKTKDLAQVIADISKAVYNARGRFKPSQ